MKRKKSPHRTRTSPSKREFNAILEAKALGLWAKSLKGCLEFLTRLKELPDMEDGGWGAGNKAYYLKRVRKLLDNTPKGASTVAREARKLLAKLE